MNVSRTQACAARSVYHIKCDIPSVLNALLLLNGILEKFGFQQTKRNMSLEAFMFHVDFYSFSNSSLCEMQMMYAKTDGALDLSHMFKILQKVSL